MYGSAAVALRNFTFPGITRFGISPKPPLYLARHEIDQSLGADVFRADLSQSQFLQFKRNLMPFFRTLEWDSYDVRLREVERIKNRLKLTAQQNQLLNEYYLGERTKADVLMQFPDVDGVEFGSEIVPSRKKAYADLIITDTARSGDWDVEIQSNNGVSQRVSENDYRSMKRSYKSIPNAVLAMPEYQALLSNVVQMVMERAPYATSMKVTAWMMSCHAFRNAPCTNSPEGIHQDGADFIVSAFVVERRNILGGKSRVFLDKDSQTTSGSADLTGDSYAPLSADLQFKLASSEPVLSRCLGEGEGLFQPDAGSPLFHDVTSIELSEDGELEGVRSILGFDVYLQ